MKKIVINTEKTEIALISKNAFFYSTENVLNDFPLT